MAYVPQPGEEDLVYNCIFLSQRESHSIPDMDFFEIYFTILILSHLELLRIELPILTSSILIKIVTIAVVLVDQFYFYMHQPIKACLLEKVIFEPDFH